MNTGVQRDLSLLVVEASKLFVERLRDILVEIAGISVAAVVDTEDSGLAVVRGGGVDLILLDLDLRQGSGLGLLRAVARLAAPPPAIVVANYDVARYRQDAIAWGAKYFLDKTRDMDQLPVVLDEIRETHPRDGLGPSNFE